MNTAQYNVILGCFPLLLGAIATSLSKKSMVHLEDDLLVARLSPDVVSMYSAPSMLSLHSAFDGGSSRHDVRL